MHFALPRLTLVLLLALASACASASSRASAARIDRNLLTQEQLSEHQFSNVPRKYRCMSMMCGLGNRDAALDHDTTDRLHPLLRWHRRRRALGPRPRPGRDLRRRASALSPLPAA